MKILVNIIYGIQIFLALFGVSFVLVLLEDLIFGPARERKARENLRREISALRPISSSGRPTHWGGILIIMAVIASCEGFLGVPAALAQPSSQEAIAVTIAAEAGGEGYKGMYAVACTIANRARARGLTPFQVVSQRNQYYGFTARNRKALYLKVKKQADFLAQNIMKIQDITGGAFYFRRPDEPRFRWCKIETYRYRNHIFYK